MSKHQLIGVNADGQGPVEHDDPDFSHWACWCPDSHTQSAVVKYNGGLGAVLCPTSRKIIHAGFPPGWTPPVKLQ